MSKDEKKAINNMKIFARVHQDMSVVTAEDMDIVLNLIEKQQAEIQFQKDINKTEQHRHKNTEKSLKGQLKKKDKIIDLMADIIYVYANLGYLGICNAELEDGTKRIELCNKSICCNECIKQYFEKKVKEEQNNDNSKPR